MPALAVTLERRGRRKAGLKLTPLALLSPHTALGAHLLLTCPGLTPMGTGLDQADCVGAETAATAGSPFMVSGMPVQVQHIAQGLSTCWPRSPVPAAWCLHLQGLQKGQGGGRQAGSRGAAETSLQPGKGAQRGGGGGW